MCRATNKDVWFEGRYPCRRLCVRLCHVMDKSVVTVEARLLSLLAVNGFETVIMYALRLMPNEVVSQLSNK